MYDNNSNMYSNMNRFQDIKSLQIPNNLQLPVYGFVFMAGLIVGSLFIQSLYKK